jgi:hypothetical protein
MRTIYVTAQSAPTAGAAESADSRRCPIFEKYFFEKFKKNSKFSKKHLLHNLYFLTIVFGSKHPLLRYNMTIDYVPKV